MTEHGICAKCKKSVGCSYADDRITGCKKFVLEPELELNNEEWIKSANTEQLAEWIAKIVDCDCCPTKRKFCDDNPCKIRFLEWLKQQHRG